MRDQNGLGRCRKGTRRTTKRFLAKMGPHVHPQIELGLRRVGTQTASKTLGVKHVFQLWGGGGNKIEIKKILSLRPHARRQNATTSLPRHPSIGYTRTASSRPRGSKHGHPRLSFVLLLVRDQSGLGRSRKRTRRTTKRFLARVAQHVHPHIELGFRHVRTQSAKKTLGVTHVFQL